MCVSAVAGLVLLFRAIDLKSTFSVKSSVINIVILVLSSVQYCGVLPSLICLVSIILVAPFLRLCSLHHCAQQYPSAAKIGHCSQLYLVYPDPRGCILK